MTKPILSPVAQKIPVQLEKHGDTRSDNYFWMKERDAPKVLDYLHQENEYYHKLTEHTKDFQKLLFEEMKGRIKEDDTSYLISITVFGTTVVLRQEKIIRYIVEKKEH